jgi:hypothetical protein
VNSSELFSGIKPPTTVSLSGQAEALQRGREGWVIAEARAGFSKWTRVQKIPQLSKASSNQEREEGYSAA